MKSLNFVDECGAVWASLLLHDLVPRFLEELKRLRGREVRAVVHLVLSDHATHVGRFPPENSELEDLNDGEPRFEGPVDLGGEGQWLKVAFGVATISEPSLNLPAGVPAGDDVVLLDTEQIKDLAIRFGVTKEAFLALTVIHELSHILHGHAHQVPGATHGWSSEGQAQEDALAVLRALLPDEALTGLALEAMKGMARLAPEQPPAYQYFDMFHDELNQLMRRDTSMGLRSWRVSVKRRVSVISKPGFDQIEAPVVGHRPAYGDHVYVCDGIMESGPWVMVGWREKSRTAHKGPETKGCTGEPVAWCQLSKGQNFSGRSPSPKPCPGEGRATELSDVEVADLRASFDPDVIDAIQVADQAWREERTALHEDAVNWKGSEWGGANPLLALDPSDEGCPIVEAWR